MIYTNTTDLLTKFREIMKDEGITVKELSQRINKTQAATSGLLKMKNISMESLNQISEAINYDLEINFIKKQNEIAEEE